MTQLEELTKIGKLLEFQVKEILIRRIDFHDAKGNPKKTKQIEAELEALYNELVGKD